MQWYVDVHAGIHGDGSREKPFRRIADAARCAGLGDEVLVLPGVYREEVYPVTAGTKVHSVVFRSATPRAAVITGAEPATGWTRVEGDVWKLVLPNSYFGAYNPYTTLVWGDWLNQELPVHTGEVCLDDKSLYETDAYEKVLHPVPDERSWDVDFTLHTWYTCQSTERDETIIYANFQGKTPTGRRLKSMIGPIASIPCRSMSTTSRCPALW